MSRGPSKAMLIVASLAELLMVLLGVAYVVTQRVEALLGWLVIGLAYLVCGGARIWSGRRLAAGPDEVRWLSQWAWMSPLLSSVVGVTSAVVALAAEKDIGRDESSAFLAGAAAGGVVLSWMMLHVGFAQIYRLVDAADPGTMGVEFPNTPDGGPSALDYVYLSFTIGTSFATSDPSIRTVPLRRAVLIHSIVSFFYNALVLAVAFEVLQQFLS